jgi:RNA polymerase sigma-54 factor
LNYLKQNCARRSNLLWLPIQLWRLPTRSNVPIAIDSCQIQADAQCVLAPDKSPLRIDPDDRQITAHILSSLVEDGLLTVPLTEISRYHHISLSRIKKVLSTIQRAEPLGVGSPTPKDALLVQLEVLSESTAVPELAVTAITKGVDLLSRRAYNELGKLLDISPKQAKQIADFISNNLNPYPARAHWGTHRQSTEATQVYNDPDIIITKLNDADDPQLVVEILSPYSGSLRVNPLFRKALPEAPDNKNEQWQSDIEQATLLVKCLQQRDHTLVRLMKKLVVLQRRFILNGDAHLSPITRARLAKELSVHESTISRAVSSKCVQLPNKRIIPLSKLFDRSLHIRTALKNIIEEEKKPLSDNQIVMLLEKLGYPVARRTVAKYRSMEGILPARLRTSNHARISP